MRGGIAMTYYALTFLACERQRQIDADYRRAIASDSLRVQLGRAFISMGARLLES